ncbi:phenylpropionate dioxygenase-like ring-hydroxylating dioxygenase large terminal subunit [Inhella inkyongensis]|uniref:Phenylpropionate dioxygenase-like ring-hydroxylating dioxygenase large terminal subunit n=1 Tax=Inhella inkyongensis TaxID=392593 RepID=A0A840S3Z2_9BURK|nr:aromatic ring-hydroxylating dioxygenase subunit alpha [Inhella inkyongensis]MBB5204272.1 phenylpropionate dioxygenase-like ring-hydroxylating dioxygenase large terminal subunit [Inhella inkyongensis]
MSDLSLAIGALERSCGTQLPVSAYFDPALYEREQERIIRPGPRYVGHQLAVPEVGDFLTLAHEGEGRALVRGHDGIQLVSNVCRHRQAVMLKGRGNTGANIVCPLHRWTYGLKGDLIGAPHFEQDPCLNLNRWNLRQWNGLLFEDNGRDIAADMAGLQVLKDLDFSGYVLDKVQIHDCNYNWKTFIEVYLEDYHVGPFHPGLGQFVTCDDLAWQWGQEFSVQTVGVKGALDKPGSKVYRRWHDALMAYRKGEPPKQGAVWLTYYPTLMVEWYPHVLVVSHLIPKGPQKTTNVVEFYYPEEIAAFEREFIEAQQAAYMETCVEDDEIGERMDAGRLALMERGDNEVGPYQSPMEDGMKHFHAWYREKMKL